MIRILTVTMSLLVITPAYAENDGSIIPASTDAAHSTADVLKDVTTASVDKGKNVFKKCTACHNADSQAKHKTGPNLSGIYNRTIAAAPNYKYSSAMTELGAQGVVWGEQELTSFLQNPKLYAKGTKMAFAGLKKQDEIDNLLAYLKTLQ